MTWIFGYGSLTFDNWEKGYPCIDRQQAALHGYRRSFNKKSVQNWGTRERPGITLNLEKAPSVTCRGVAFEINDADPAVIQRMLEALRRREACGPTSVQIQLADSREVQALTYIYTGANLLDATATLSQKVEMIRKATGTSGSAIEYVRRNFEGLKAVSLDDPAVSELWIGLNRKEH